jgi:hypothetical protein
VAGDKVNTEIDVARFRNSEQEFADLLQGHRFTASGGRLVIELPAYGVYWLGPTNEDMGDA